MTISVKLEISGCEGSFVSRAHFLPGSTMINQVVKEAMGLATKQGLAWWEYASPKVFICDDLTGQPLESKRKLSDYYPESGCATIRVCINDFYTRAIIAMG